MSFELSSTVFLQIPFRCSNVPTPTTDQKISTFFPTVLALRYLKSIDKLSENKKTTGKRNLETIYQYILSKKLSGGAFSEWNDGVPSIETTAFVAKFLSVAKEWIEINDQLIAQALSFLKGKQAQDGKFVNQDTINRSFEDDVALTSFTVISFMENEAYIERHKPVINKALKFIDGKFNELDDSFTLAISAYALALHKHESASKFLNKLMEKAVRDDDKTYWNGNGLSLNIETAAYAILVFVKIEKSFEAKNIFNWLLSQQSQTGDFSTPKDTVIALQAVAEMAKNLHSGEFNLNVYFLYGLDQVKGVYIDRKTAMELKNVTIPTWEGVTVQGNGTGLAYVQVWQKYFKKTSDSFSSKFNVEVKPRMENPNFLRLNICLRINGQGESKVTVAEITLPSGFEFHKSNTAGVKVNLLKGSILF